MEAARNIPTNPIEQSFFLSEILGARVLLNKKKVGKLADLVMKENGPLPVVTHLLVNRPFGETALVAWESVSQINNHVVEIHVENIDALPKEPPEGAIQIKDHILDKKALDLDGREVEVVYDVRLVRKGGRLYVSEVDLSRYGLLRRIGLTWLANFIYRMAESIQEQTISWTYIEPLPSSISSFKGNVQLKVLKEALGDMHPVDVADILEELDHEQRMAIFQELETEQASDTLEEIDPSVQRQVVESLDLKKAAELIDEMTPAQAADILAILPADEAREIIDLLNQENQEKIQPILDTQEEHILNLATEEFLKYPLDCMAQTVVDGYRTAAKGKDVIMYLYVVDAEDRLLGVLDIKELLLAEETALLGDIMTEQVITLEPDTTFKEAVDMFSRYGFRALPITDEQDHILGVVTYRDMMNLTHRFIE
jgi:CBS domain-containing protein